LEELPSRGNPQLGSLQHPWDMNASGDLVFEDEIYRDDWDGYVQIDDLLVGTPEDMASWFGGDGFRNLTMLNDRNGPANSGQITGRIRTAESDTPVLYILTPELPTPPNDPPVVMISSPGDGSEFNSGDNIAFAGAASDTEDGNLTANLAWTSSIDGNIGSGGSFFTTLSDGVHTVTASVTDSAGATGSDSISITVGDPPPEATLHVAGIEMDLGLKSAGPNTSVWGIAGVTIVDTAGIAVDGATVHGHWEGATTDTDSGMTDASGSTSLTSDRVKNPPLGTVFTFVVDDVVKDGWTYDPSANTETSDSAIWP